jgi:toxin ParE1/3/4
MSNEAVGFSAVLETSRSRARWGLSQYFLESNIDAGEKLFKSFNQRFHNLTQFPNIGKLYPHLLPDIRGLLVDKYIIFYRVTPIQIEIIRIVDGRQDLTQIFPNGLRS